MPTRRALVRCETSPGQFQNEYAVSIHLADGREVSFFADEELVEAQSDQQFIQVLAFDPRSDASEETVLLPSEGFENGSRWARVSSRDVR